MPIRTQCGKESYTFYTKLCLTLPTIRLLDVFLQFSSYFGIRNSGASLNNLNPAYPCLRSSRAKVGPVLLFFWRAWEENHMPENGKVQLERESASEKVFFSWGKILFGAIWILCWENMRCSCDRKLRIMHNAVTPLWIRSVGVFKH